MTWLGKTLAILNAIAAAAFIYFVSQDYEKREAWSLAVFRHQLAVSGLPFDDDSDPDVLAALTGPDETVLTGTFQGLGEPVTTVLKEVDRVQRRLVQEIGQMPGDPQQRAALSGWLRALATTAAERAQIASEVDGKPDYLYVLSDQGPFGPQLQQKFPESEKRAAFVNETLGDVFVADEAQRPALLQQRLTAAMIGLEPGVILQKITPKVSIEEIMSRDGLFGRAFEDVLRGKQNEKQGQRDVTAGRQAAAHLLFALAQARTVEEPTMGRREQVVVGLPAYVVAVARQGGALRQMIVEAKGAIAAERGIFETAHALRLQHIEATAVNSADMQARVVGATADEAKWTVELKTRQQVLEGVKSDVAETNKALEAALASQTEREQALFEVNRSIAATVKKNLELERDIRRLEKPR